MLARMGRGPNRIRVAALIVGAAAALPAAALAVNLGDAGGVSYRLHAKHAAVHHTADARTPCPKGESPTGGGFQASAEMGFDEFQSAASKPLDGGDADRRPDDGWEVRAQGASHGLSAASYAICDKGTHRYVSASHTVKHLGAAKVQCPRGLHVTGGGGSLGKAASSNLIASFPTDGKDRDTKPDDGWEAWGQAQAPDKLRVFAVCGRKQPSYHQATDSLDPGFGSRGLAMCGAHRHLLGVGGRIGDAPSATARVELAEPNDIDNDRVYDDSGASFAINDVAAPAAAERVTYAICTR